MLTFRQPFKNDWPVTQRYGEAVTSAFHTGIDYACPLNTPILASADGEVMFAGWDPTGYGNLVTIRHDDDHSTLYAHLGSIHVKTGEKVRQGSLIGHSGTTGNSTGPHLHFEARRVWNDWKTHTDPILLPLTLMKDDPSKTEPAAQPSLKAGPVSVAAHYGVYAHNADFTAKTVLPFGTELNFTGKTVQHNGLVFCECTLWIAESDGETTLLTNLSQ